MGGQASEKTDPAQPKLKAKGVGGSRSVQYAADSVLRAEARLPIEEQLSLKLRRFIEAAIPELSGKVQVEKRR